MCPCAKSKLCHVHCVQGKLVYEQTLPGVAYFNVDPSSGDITLQSSLRLDTRIQIVVGLKAVGVILEYRQAVLVRVCCFDAVSAARQSSISIIFLSTDMSMI